ncbi:hypothetical protein E2C01_013751 [Portunus trituberculatus]|uniref:Uncharacterized protein n=1 Tax=Portunus trituberculatus TaxID=210409 RepID=A0A5B7DH29_PORTR|nr:hypothetical protein [Portunus trituberculatus]
MTASRSCPWPGQAHQPSSSETTKWPLRRMRGRGRHGGGTLVFYLCHRRGSHVVGAAGAGGTRPRVSNIARITTAASGRLNHTNFRSLALLSLNKAHHFHLSTSLPHRRVYYLEAVIVLVCGEEGATGEPSRGSRSTKPDPQHSTARLLTSPSASALHPPRQAPRFGTAP